MGTTLGSRTGGLALRCAAYVLGTTTGSLTLGATACSLAFGAAADIFRLRGRSGQRCGKKTDDENFDVYVHVHTGFLPNG